MFVQVEALYIDGEALDYASIGVEPPEELLAFKPLWINLATVTHFESAANPEETILSFIHGRNLHINMTEDNFLLLLDLAGMLPNINPAALASAA